MILKSLTYEQLIENGVSQKFAKILTDPESYHHELKIHIGKTNWDYFIPKGVENIVPLWDDNADTFARWERNGKTEYVWLFHDDPNWSLIATSEQGIMCKLWQSWAEFQETDDECQRFADAIGFKYCEEALRLWDEDDINFDEWIINIKD